MWLQPRTGLDTDVREYYNNGCPITVCSTTRLAMSPGILSVLLLSTAARTTRKQQQDHLASQ